MSETVKVGIVGIGNMGSAHAKSIFSGNIKGMELASACSSTGRCSSSSVLSVSIWSMACSCASALSICAMCSIKPLAAL